MGPFGVVLAFVGPHRGNSIGLMAGIVIASGIGSFSFVSRARERVLDVSSLQSLATSYRPVFFLGFAVSESTVLLGFVAVFVTGRLWIFALGLIIGIANFARIWPSAANIDFMQRRITDRGSPLSLGEALMLPTDRP